jgi:hypothetical protein
MARNSKNKGKQNFGVEFIAYSLTAKDKEDFRKFQAKPPMAMDNMLAQCMQDGHKVTFSFSDANDSFVCSVTGKPDMGLNAGRCYTSHAKDYTTALWVAMFKYYVIWENAVWESLASDEDFG